MIARFILFMAVGCSPGGSAHGDSSGHSPADSGTSDSGEGGAADTADCDDSGAGTSDSADTGPSEASIDECGWADLPEAAGSRALGEMSGARTATWGEIMLFTDAGAMQAWWTSLGSPDTIGAVDFETEQAVGIVTLYGSASTEGERAVGVRASSGSTDYVLGLDVYVPCGDRSDDIVSVARLWATPPGTVSVCRFGTECE